MSVCCCRCICLRYAESVICVSSSAVPLSPKFWLPQDSRGISTAHDSTADPAARPPAPILLCGRPCYAIFPALKLRHWSESQLSVRQPSIVNNFKIKGLLCWVRSCLTRHSGDRCQKVSAKWHVMCPTTPHPANNIGGKNMLTCNLPRVELVTESE